MAEPREPLTADFGGRRAADAGMRRRGTPVKESPHSYVEHARPVSSPGPGRRGGGVSAVGARRAAGYSDLGAIIRRQFARERRRRAEQSNGGDERGSAQRDDSYGYTLQRRAGSCRDTRAHQDRTRPRSRANVGRLGRRLLQRAYAHSHWRARHWPHSDRDGAGWHSISDSARVSHANRHIHHG